MRALVLWMLLAASAAAAPVLAYHAQMGGAQLVRDMLAEPAEGLNSIRRERAMGYIDGVMDATAGLQWCPQGKPVPHELNYLVTEKIARMSPETLKGGAAPLVLNALRTLYPCAAEGVKP